MPLKFLRLGVEKTVEITLKFQLKFQPSIENSQNKFDYFYNLFKLLCKNEIDYCDAL